MTRIVTPTLGTSEWRAGLADPHLHWKRGHSAWELAVAWEASRKSATGIPASVSGVLATHPTFANARLLLGIVEHRVRLDTEKTPSQNDLWAVLGTDHGQVSVAIEAKAGEEFDRSLRDWLADDKGTKASRLSFLCRELDVAEVPHLDLRYQLFHRAASATLEARRWQISRALMLVQSFKESASAWTDYVAFATWMGLTAARDTLVGPHNAGGVELYLGWVDCQRATDGVAASAV